VPVEDEEGRGERGQGGAGLAPRVGREGGDEGRGGEGRGGKRGRDSGLGRRDSRRAQRETARGRARLAPRVAGDCGAGLNSRLAGREGGEGVRLRRLPPFRLPFFLMLTLLTMQNLILPHVDTSDYAEPRFQGPCCKWKSFFGKINGGAELVPRVLRVWRGRGAELGILLRALA
jgi:hypothetical protein